MNQLTLSQLRDLADSLSLLAGTFQTKPIYLRAKQIRQADKCLISADAFFTQSLCQEAKQWKSAYEGLLVLKNKLKTLEDKQEKINQIEEKIKFCSQSTEEWFKLESTQRHRIIQNAKRASSFLLNPNDQKEQHVLQRYQRYQFLKDLIPYTDNTNYLCEAVFHYENREKYEDNIEKLEVKIKKANERKKTVQRGFWIAIFFCIFIATIPICFPFSISLWRRKREIEAQITNYEETLRRETKRLEAADEGSLIAQEMKEALGNVSLERIREILVEVKELRLEFLSPDRRANPTALLLYFFDSEKNLLNKVFGDMPHGVVQKFQWIEEKVNQYQNTETHIVTLEEQKKQLTDSQKQLLKGYSKEILLQSIERLNGVLQGTFQYHFQQENHFYFAELCLEISPLLPKIRELLFYASRNQPIDLPYWNLIKMKIQSMSNTLTLCVLDSELMINQYEAPLWVTQEDEKLESIL